MYRHASVSSYVKQEPWAPLASLQDKVGEDPSALIRPQVEARAHLRASQLGKDTDKLEGPVPGGQEKGFGGCYL